MRFLLRFLCLLFLGISVGYTQSGKRNRLLTLFNQFENELSFSREKAKLTADRLIQVAEHENTERSLALMQSVKAMRSLKIFQQIDSARIYGKAAYEAHEFLKDSMALFKDLHILYECALIEKKQDSSFLYASQEMALSEKMKEPFFKTIAYIDMGDAYYLNRQHKEFLTYQKKALDIAQKNDFKELLVDVYINVAQSHLKLSRQRTTSVLDSAIFYGKKALKLAKESNYGNGIYESTIVLSDFLNVNGQHHEALSLIETVINLPIEQRPIQVDFNAPFYYAVILKDNGRYKQAKNIVKDLVQDAREEDHSQKSSLNFFLSVLYAYNNQPDSTDFAIKQAIINRNANEEVKIDKKMIELQTQYQTNQIKAEKETALANAKLAKVESKKNQAYFIGASLIGILILVSAFLYTTRLKASKKSALMATELAETQKRLHIEKKYKESELKALKSQMNPHFIFNALNSIQEYIITNKKNEASDYLGRFSDLIRRYLNQSNAKGISLAEEIESLKLYLEIETLRFEDDFKYQVIYEDELDDSDIVIPSMMVQPYVENAIRHGLLHKKGTKRLSVYFVIKEDTVVCKIKDNGVGRKRGIQLRQKRNAAHKSFAEKATKDRLELFNSEAKRKVGVKIEDLFMNGEASGTKVILNIPII
ncbi:histidine kinase [Spongiivirga sp. MCCC 1A20706]|uniref:histidine kinase n=1 Tax=Spongiivirga sp. MCCC 1A20706 TaxID=3160963 RepID=UPI0039778914